MATESAAVTSGFVRRLVERAYQKAKRDPSYQVPESLPVDALLRELAGRGLMALRGLLWRWRFRRVEGVLFLGSHVSFRSPGLISLGSSCTLHDYVRIDALSRHGVTLGTNVTLREHCIIECTGVLRHPGEGLIVGNNVGFAQHCFVGVRGPVRIGNDVQIGPRVTIYAENHNFDDVDLPIRKQGVRRQGIAIDDDCWLGSGCTILDGVTVGRGSVIAANSVVTRDVPPLSVVAGVPGRVLRQRGAACG